MPKSDNDQKIYSVSQITRKIRTLLEFQVGDVWIEGEISNLRKQASGHQYFTLKDPDAQIAAVLFRGNARNLDFDPEDGTQVQAFGELSVYEARGQYQLIVRHLQPKGAGALQAKFEALKSKLQSEGLFDSELKKPIPPFPNVLALVTSPTGAALRDMLNILSRRAPWVHILICPVRVQGDGAAAEIAHAIDFLNQASGKSIPLIDTIITGRGGGSIEDLWCFNDESVARSIYASKIPIVSAVGHEIDFTIADFTADLRAPTPSAAAELTAPDQSNLRHRLLNLNTRMTQSLSAVLEGHAKVLDLLSRGALAKEPLRKLQEYRQQIDFIAANLAAAPLTRLDEDKRRLDYARHTLQAHRPDSAIARYRERIEAIARRINSSAQHFVADRRQHVQATADLLRSLGPTTTFSRGFSMTLDQNGNAITSAKSVTPGDRIRTRLGDGDFESDVAP
ncbi:MAG: exodeoxyribonuclease VII large subunit [Verrucomicrobiota bacterium]